MNTYFLTADLRVTLNMGKLKIKMGKRRWALGGCENGCLPACVCNSMN